MIKKAVVLWSFFSLLIAVLFYSICPLIAALYTWLWHGIPLGVLVVVLAIILLVFYDLSSKDISTSHTMKGLLQHYIAINSLKIIGRFMSRRFENTTYLCQETQEKILMSRLKVNKDTAYGRLYSFEKMKTADDFICGHPLTRYPHYELYVERIAKGERNVLTKQDPMMLAVTSGTSGQCSVLPFTKKQSGLFFLQGISVLYYHMLKAYPNLQNLRKNLKFFYTPRWRESEAGLPIGPNSSSPTNSKQILNLYTTPLPGFEILDEREALYVHLLFGLKERKLGMIEANFASLIHTGLHFLEQEWRNLVADIKHGKVNSNLNISKDIRERLDELLKPDCTRAMELQVEFEKGFDNIVKRIWPTCSLLLCANTGTFQLYSDRLRDTYCRDIPVYSPLYAATEGLIGLNIWPLSEKTEYLPVPSNMFYEFIPVENSLEDQPTTFLLHQVSVGCDYEVVVTTLSGLYRYRLGDVVRVTRFLNQCPVLEFMYRQGQLLNVRGEKISEDTLYEALCKAVSEWLGVTLVDYCCAESILAEKGHQSMPHYIVFVEVVDENGKCVLLTDEQKQLVDSNLRKSFVYDSFRSKQSIAPPVVYTVKRDSFVHLRDFMIQTTNASANQFKVPRVLRRRDSFEFMMGRVM